jgi:tRNA nucleotidyltransferase (CCA-adding enzyme)
MVLKQAVTLSVKTSIRFAALCHDLGKSLTLEEYWPAHRGHEKSGIPLVEHIADKLKVPTDHKRLALKVCQFHLHCHKAFELKPSTILKMFDQLDVWRKPEEFDDFLVACHADATGRLGFENNDYPQAIYLKELYMHASKIKAKEFVEQGLKGIEIKEAMKKAQLNVISNNISAIKKK